MTSIEKTVPLIKKMTDKEYFSFKALNGSTLKKFLSQPLPHVRYDIENPKEPTDSMRLGTLVHCMYLEPEEVKNRYKPLPRAERLNIKDIGADKYFLEPKKWTLDLFDFDHNYVLIPEEFLSSKGELAKTKKKMYEDWLLTVPTKKKILDRNEMKETFEKHSGKTVIKEKDILNIYLEIVSTSGVEFYARKLWAQALLMTRALQRHELAKQFVPHPNGTPELVFIANVPELDNELCKCKMDYYIQAKKKDSDEKAFLIFDLKTTRETAHAVPEFINPEDSKLSEAFVKLMYDMSAWFYSAVHEAATGEKIDQFIFICVQNDRYPYFCTTHVADISAFEHGEIIAKKAFQLYKKCKETGKYPPPDQLRYDKELQEWIFEDSPMLRIFNVSERRMNRVKQ